MSVYTEVIAKIESTFLGIEDHGIFTCSLQLDYGTSSQGTPGYAGVDGDFVRGIIEACGVDSWEKVKGRIVLALKASEEWNAPVVGLAPLSFERGKPFFFEEWAAKKRADA